MIICDGKHDKQVAGTGNMRVKGKTQIKKQTIDLDIRIRTPGAEYCDECMMAFIKDIDLSKLLANSRRVQAPPTPPE